VPDVSNFYMFDIQDRFKLNQILFMKIPAYIFLIIFLSSCSELVSEKKWIGVDNLDSKISDTSIKEILNNFQNQRECWNESDHYCYVDNYTSRGDARTISKAGVTIGKTTILRNYLQFFPAERKGILDFKNFSIYVINEYHAMVLGSYDLVFPSSESRSGYFSVLMIREDSGWKILTDHSS